MTKTFRKILLSAALVLSVVANSYAQEAEPDIEALEKEALEQEMNQQDQIEDDLQDLFCIIETKCNHVFNPQITSYSADAQILTGLYEGLFSYNPVTLEPQYAIAQSYTVSRDKKRMTITLRQNACFSNGEAITAYTVRDSWLQLLETPEAPYASMLDIIRGAQEYRIGDGLAKDVGIIVKDNFTLCLYLTEPANYLPKVLCHSAFSVVHPNPEVYSGPYMLTMQTENSIMLEQNPYYWDLAHTNIKRIVIAQSTNGEENTAVYNAGLVDWVDSDFIVEKLLDKDAFQMNAEFGTSYYFFKNSCKKPAAARKDFNPWDYDEFRNAVIEVFPWESFRAGTIVPAETLVYPLTGYPTVEGFNYTDVLEAKEKMKEAKAKYGFSADTRFPLVLEISEYALSAGHEELLKNSLAEIGVDLEVRRVPTYLYIGNVKNSDADMFSYSWIGDFADPLAFLSLFQTGSTLNDSGWSNKEYDALLREAATVSDAERYVLLAKAETILLDSGMILPLYHPVAFNLIDTKEVGGWSPNAFNIHPLKYLYKKSTKSTVPNIVLK